VLNGVLSHNNLYCKPLVYEQSVYEFSLIKDAQINPFFLIYEILPLTNRLLFPSGSNGELIFVLLVFA
jgi:hypothetical protein